MTKNKKFVHEPIELLEMKSVTTEDGRRYQTPEGLELPSITTVLSILSRKSIAAWRKRVGEKKANAISKQASSRGTSVHTICEKYLDNDPDYLDGVMPNNIQTFQTMKPIMNDMIGTIYAQEAPLYSTHLGVAGRVDCVAEFNGKISIIDFKTSRKFKKRDWCHSYFMQECAYAIMWEERTGIPITQLITFIAVDNSSPLIYVEHRDDWVNPLRDVIKQYEEENTSVKF